MKRLSLVGEREEKVDWVLVDIYVGRLSRLEFKLTSNIIWGSFWEFVDYTDAPT